MKKSEAVELFDQHFTKIQDPRDKRGLRHQLKEILIISILSIICGADGFIEMEEFGKSKIKFLKTFLKLPNGIPSHDTFGRVFCLIDPEEFRKCFIEWVKDICGDLTGDIINIDGKALRHSYDTAAGKSMIYMVSAWANSNNLVLGQIKVEEKSNEITAIPKLLKLLGNLKEEVEEAFDKFDAKQKAIEKGTFDQQIQVDHGRIEERKCYVIPAKEFLSPLILNAWAGILSIVMIEAYTTFKNGKRKGEQTYQKRYYITTLSQVAQRINLAVQTHWGIENKVHWILDVAFSEDDSRVRKGHADENFAIARHVALNKLKNETSCKRGVKAKRKKAGWDNEYLLKVLAA